MPQPEGGFTVTSPVLPELITEGDSVEDVMTNVQDALQAVVEAHQYMGRELPFGLQLPDAPPSPVWLENLDGGRQLELSGSGLESLHCQIGAAVTSSSELFGQQSSSLVSNGKSLNKLESASRQQRRN